MRYWLTLHWRDSRDAEDYPAVWTSSYRPNVAVTMEEGDFVAVYETRKSGGEGRIIGHGKVRACVNARINADGWRLVARLENSLYDDGGVGWKDMCQILGHPMTHGLEEITEAQFDRLTRRRLPRK